MLTVIILCGLWIVAAFMISFVIGSIVKSMNAQSGWNPHSIKPDVPGAYATRFMTGKIQVAEEAFWNGAEWRYPNFSYSYCYYQEREWMEIPS